MKERGSAATEWNVVERMHVLNSGRVGRGRWEGLRESRCEQCDRAAMAVDHEAVCAVLCSWRLARIAVYRHLPPLTTVDRH
jgi:hypothetical protein